MSGDRINLIPKDLREEQTIKFEHALAAVAGSILVVMIGLTLRQSFVLGRTAESQADLSSQNSVLAERIIQVQGASLQLEARAVHTRKIEQILSERITWNEIFRELTLLVPESTWLTSLVLINGDGKRQVTLTGEAPHLKKVANLYSALENSYYFRQTSIKYSEKLEAMTPDLYRFQMESFISKSGPKGTQ